MRNIIFIVTIGMVAAFAAPTLAQEYGTGSRNIRQIGQLPLGTVVRADAAAFLVDVQLDQRPDKPYAYVAEQSGWAVVDLSDPATLRIAALVPMAYVAERGQGISSIDYLEVDGTDLVVVGRDNQLAVFNTTGLENDERPVEIATLGGSFESMFAYKHSSGASLLISTSVTGASIYDAADLLDGTLTQLAEIPTPEQADSAMGYTSVFAAFHSDTDSDRFYGAGTGGYHVYDITDLASVRYVTSALPAAVRRGLSVSPSADGRFLVTTAAYRTAPVQIFDLNPVSQGRITVARTSSGAWANNWMGFHLDHETRWPYVFVAAAEQGLQIFNARDVEEPYTVGYFATSRRPDGSVNDRPEEVGGAVAIDVRNYDGLIAVGDQQTGVFFVKLDGFSNWDGRGWGYPNISSAQDWLNGPDGSTRFDR